VVRVKLKGVFPTYKVLKDGTRKCYWYHRATGGRLHGEPGSPEFMTDLAAAEQNIRDRLGHSGTFNGLVREYTLSEEFENTLAPSTQAEYRRMLTKAESIFGDMPMGALEDWRVRKDFLDWREKVARQSGFREADYRLSAISAMLTWAVQRGRLSENHLKGFKRLYHSNRAEIIWLPEHIEAFMRVAPIELQQALLLALHTGQREGDLLRLPWSAYDGKTIRLRQGKSRRGKRLGQIIEIPCTAALRRMLDGIERASPLMLSTTTGRSFKKRYFSQLWNRVMRNAGLETVTLPDIADPVKLHFHDLRGTTVTLLSEAGCTAQQVATITGHSLKTVSQILERYLARTRGLAEQAIFNFENSPRTKFANQLQTKGGSGTNANEKDIESQ
jgi:integrase